MPLFTIAYDLNKQKDYKRLIEALREAGAKKILFSDWTLRGNYTPKQLFDQFLQFIDGDDALLVAQIDGNKMFGIRTITPMKDV